MAIEDNKRLVRQALEEIYERGDAEAVDELIEPRRMDERERSYLARFLTAIPIGVADRHA